MDAPQQSDPQPGSNPARPDGARQNVASGPAQQIIYVPQPMGPFRRWTAWLGWVGFTFSVILMMGMVARFYDYFDTSGGIQEQYHSRSKTAGEKVAVIRLRGVIALGDGFVKRQIDRVKNDKAIKAVVLRIDSPGGTITGSDYILHHLRELKKERKIPIVVSMGSMAASGGYYVAMAVGEDPDTIYAEPTTTTGSIGVIIPHYDVSGLLERFDVKDDSIVSHPRKQMLSMTRTISPEDREVLQQYLQEAFGRFKDVVKSGRPALRDDEQKLDALATGEIFTATQAQESGLVDKLGFIEDAIGRAIEMGEFSNKQVRVVTYRAPPTLIDALIATQTPKAGFPDLNSLFELSAPKAYYLVTSMPPLLSYDSQSD